MKRRAFIALIGSAAVWPLAAHAQPPTRVFRIGFLTGTPLAENAALRQIFREGLRDLGFVEGKNIAIEWRSWEGHPNRRRAYAAELVRLNVSVIVAVGSGDTRAVREATAKIPIVMVESNDAVGTGLVASLAHPGGNITGLTRIIPELSAKRLDILKEAVPRISRVAVLSTSGRSSYAEIQKDVGRTAEAIGVTLQYANIRSPTDIEFAFQAAVKGRADAILFLTPRPLYISRRSQVIELAMKNRLPVIYERRADVKAGGLMSYGVHRPDLWRRAAGYVSKILKGATPSDLPVEQPTKFELVVNLKTAKALGIAFAPSILLRADEVIE